jgi:hypothetical protein
MAGMVTVYATYIVVEDGEDMLSRISPGDKTDS